MKPMPWFPLSLFGWRFWLPMLTAGMVLTLTAAALSIPLAAAVLAITLACMAFFRDPPRRIPQGSGVMLSPADGKITEISRMDHCDELGGPALRIGIFLSVLDVHINRSPCDALVESTRYTPGEFLDARHPQCGQRNESNLIVLKTAGQSGGGERVAVIRQVSGAIARRIIAPVYPNDRLGRGQRFGMIAFGSRTELILPQPENWEVCVHVGQMVKGGKSILLSRRK